MDLHQLQQEMALWSFQNFGNQPSWRPLLGVQEEVGELSHAYLKREQRIRNQDYHVKMVDAVADILIYLADFCNKEKIDMAVALGQVWEQVKERNWKKFPKDGRTE